MQNTSEIAAVLWLKDSCCYWSLSSVLSMCISGLLPSSHAFN